MAGAVCAPRWPVLPADIRQLTLGEMFADATGTADVPAVEVPAHQRRRKAKDADSDEGDLRFDDTVPVEQIILDADIPADELDDYEQIGT